MELLKVTHWPEEAETKTMGMGGSTAKCSLLSSKPAPEKGCVHVTWVQTEKGVVTPAPGGFCGVGGLCAGQPGGTEYAFLPLGASLCPLDPTSHYSGHYQLTRWGDSQENPTEVEPRSHACLCQRCLAPLVALDQVLTPSACGLDLQDRRESWFGEPSRKRERERCYHHPKPGALQQDAAHPPPSGQGLKCSSKPLQNPKDPRLGRHCGGQQGSSALAQSQL